MASLVRWNVLGLMESAEWEFPAPMELFLLQAEANSMAIQCMNSLYIFTARVLRIRRKETKKIVFNQGQRLASMNQCASLVP